MKNLSLAARLYVSVVVAVGACLLVVFTPWSAGMGRPSLFFSLLLVSTLCSWFKVNLPVGGSTSSMSVSYAVDFASLILIGPALTMLITALSTWVHCTVRAPRERNPVHRILFSMASLIVTVQVRDEPEQPPPLQPPKVSVPSGLAVRVTWLSRG